MVPAGDLYFSNVSEIRGPGDPVRAPRGSSELDYELEIAALVDTPVRDLTADRGEEAIVITGLALGAPRCCRA